MTPDFSNLPPAPPAPKFRLLHDQILVEPIRKMERWEAKSESGLLFLPDTPKHEKGDFFWWGRAILTGPGDGYRYGKKLGRHDERSIYRHPSGRFPMEVKAGDVVLYERRPWGDVTLEGREFTVVHETQHIAVIVNREGECA